ncbi:MAG TPA: hypothetical protein VF627_13305 [Abditibacterium sp.]|jgi:hypothetical protein
MKRLLSPRISVFIAATVLALPKVAPSCPQCRPLVQKGIYNATFAPNVFEVMLPILVIFSLAAAWHVAPRFVRSSK